VNIEGAAMYLVYGKLDPYVISHLDLCDQKRAAATTIFSIKAMLRDRTDVISASWMGSRNGALR